MGAVGTAVLAIALTLGACQLKPDIQNNASGMVTADEPLAELSMKPIRVESYGLNGLEWILDAPVADGYSRKNVIHAKRMKMSLFDKGEPSSVITAKEAIVNAKLNQKDPGKVERTTFNDVTLDPGDMMLRGDVVVVSTDGTKVLTDWARYEKRSELITSTAPVKVLRDDSVTEGTGLRATSDLSSVEIYDQTLIIKGKE